MRDRKRGEILSANVIGFTLIVIAVVVILGLTYLVYKQVSDSGLDREACHQSIVVRATARAGAFNLDKGIPLKCKTEKICFSLSGEDCDELTSTKDSPVIRKDLPRCDESCDDEGKCIYECDEAREKIKEVMTQSIVSCHNMLGEGKLNFFPHESFGDDYLPDFDSTKYGLICTRIVFDDESKEKIENIGYGELYGFMERKVVAGTDKSALEYLYPGFSKGTDYLKIHQVAKENKERKVEDYKGLGEPKEWAINLNQENGYAILSAITTLSQGEALMKAGGVTTGAAAIGGVLLWTGIGSPLGVALLAGSAGGAMFLYEFDDSYSYIPPTPFPFDHQKLKELGFYSFEIVS